MSGAKNFSSWWLVWIVNGAGQASKSKRLTAIGAAGRGEE